MPQSSDVTMKPDVLLTTSSSLFTQLKSQETVQNAFSLLEIQGMGMLERSPGSELSAWSSSSLEFYPPRM